MAVLDTADTKQLRVHGFGAVATSGRHVSSFGERFVVRRAHRWQLSCPAHGKQSARERAPVYTAFTGLRQTWHPVGVHVWKPGPIPASSNSGRGTSAFYRAVPVSKKLPVGRERRHAVRQRSKSGISISAARETSLATTRDRPPDTLMAAST